MEFYAISKNKADAYPPVIWRLPSHTQKKSEKAHFPLAIIFQPDPPALGLEQIQNSLWRALLCRT